MLAFAMMAVIGPTPGRCSKTRDRSLDRSIVLDPLVDPGNPPHRHEACPAAHLARPHPCMVVLAQGSSSQRAQSPSQAQNCKGNASAWERSTPYTARTFLRSFGRVTGRQPPDGAGRGRHRPRYSQDDPDRHRDPAPIICCKLHTKRQSPDVYDHRLRIAHQ